MKNPLNQFDALSSKEKLSFNKEAMPPIAEILANDSPKMMAEMMPMWQGMMKSCNMDMQGMMGEKQTERATSNPDTPQGTCCYAPATPKLLTFTFS